MAKPSPSHAQDPSLVAIGDAIRELRKQQGISQESLALSAGIDRSYLGGIERGEHNVALINLFRISNALKIKISDILKHANLEFSTMTPS